ncbi:MULTISPECIES: multidrug effflux MFS transporter [Vibrio]|uniref:Bcr/CflA family efflux transporter n=1 Tax=Vibrio casei TaxID=673372 RepID=A0A368LJC2_9VIBR|nr:MULTISPECIES: multidrug effflux MFS transporter [Vibrio]RCS70788.1 MFS transporter [Vibrio casei]SJN25053.1 Multidrug resistance protein D [Vibrio casei]HBV76844.1 MFS transporter [Vibrio sp.]
MKTKTLNVFKKTPLLLAMMIIATGQVGVSIYLPSLPLISHDLAASQAQVQSIVTFFLISFGLSQLFYGPLSDAIGRRPVFLLGQGVYLVGTLICVLWANSFDALLFGRLLQGLGAGSASVLGRSVLRDSYNGTDLTKALSYLSITASILPIVSPVFGGWAAYHFGWQSVFTAVLIYLIAIVTLGWKVLPETLPYPKSRFSPVKVIKGYTELITNKQVLSSASYNWISYLGAVVSLSVLPFLLQQQLGMTVSDYGQAMIIPSAGLLIGSLTVNRLNRYCSKSQLLSLAFGLMAIAGIWLLVMPLATMHLIIGFTILTIAQGMSFPISMSLLLEPHPHRVGAVSAFSGSIQMCIAGFFGEFLVRHFIATQTDLGMFYLMSTLVMISILTMSRKIQMVVVD